MALVSLPPQSELPPSQCRIAPVGAILSGKYRIESVLGVGGMGVVVAARHLGLDQLYAIKLLDSQGAARPEVVERLMVEGRAAARLMSPHTARVFDVGRLDDGSPYLVMELLQGTDLKTLIDTVGRQPLETVVRWGVAVCRALEEAHAAGVIHRDIKPANLFLVQQPSGAEPLLKVLDFGIAKLDIPTAPSLTRTSMAMGTPQYMAPEQTRDAKRVDARADVWGLGTVLYETATGRPAFEGDSLADFIVKVLRSTPPLPSTVVPGLPTSFDRIIERCLAKWPEERYGSMLELRSALECLLEAPLPAPIAIERARLDRTVVLADSTGYSVAPPTAGTTGAACGGTQILPQVEGKLRKRRGWSRTMKAAVVLSCTAAVAGALTSTRALWSGSDRAGFTTRPASMTQESPVAAATTFELAVAPPSSVLSVSGNPVSVDAPDPPQTPGSVPTVARSQAATLPSHRASTADRRPRRVVQTTAPPPAPPPAVRPKRPTLH